MKSLKDCLFAGLLTLGLCLNTGFVSAGDNDAIVYRVVDAAYEDVLFEINEVLTNRGLVKNYTAHVADMLNRTAADVGATKTVYKNGDVIEFCSATLSRAAMEADPNNIALCPYSLFAYETSAAPGKVVVGYRKIIGGTSAASQAALADVNRLLQQMLDSVAGEF